MQLKIVLISLTTTQQEKQIAFSRALMSERHIRFPINFETIVICKSQSTKDEKNPVQNQNQLHANHLLLTVLALAATKQRI